MIRADSINTTSRRSRFPMKAAPAVGLLELRDRIFKCYAEARSYDDEINRLAWILHDQRDLLYKDCTMRPAVVSEKISATRESKEQSRLIDLQNAPYAEMDKLISQMWKIPATTDAGRLAKVEVLLECILRTEWQGPDEDLDYGIREARQLLIEFVGGEAAVNLRFQFCTGVAGEA
jgi:hypothetical protein